MRHFLFVVPPLAVLAGIGFDWLLAPIAARRTLALARCAGDRRGAVSWNAVLLVGCTPTNTSITIRWSAALKAPRRFDTDYWVNIMPEAVDDLEAYVASSTDRQAAAAHRYTVGGLRRAPAVRKRSRRRACNGPPTGATPTSSSRRRT